MIPGWKALKQSRVIGGSAPVQREAAWVLWPEHGLEEGEKARDEVVRVLDVA